MKHLLVVEDNTTKQLAIEQAVEGNDRKILAAQNIATAYSLISVQPWDLIILDMTFHASLGPGHESLREPLAGLEVLQFIARQRMTTPVIVATQHSSFDSTEIPGLDSIEKLHSALSRAFPRNYKTTVAVDLFQDDWKGTLRTVVEAILAGNK